MKANTLKKLKLLPSQKHVYLVSIKSCIKAFNVKEKDIKEFIKAGVLYENIHFVYQNKRLFISKQGVLKLCLLFQKNHNGFDVLYQQLFQGDKKTKLIKQELLKYLIVLEMDAKRYNYPDAISVYMHLNELRQCVKKL